MLPLALAVSFFLWGESALGKGTTDLGPSVVKNKKKTINKMAFLTSENRQDRNEVSIIEEQGEMSHRQHTAEREGLLESSLRELALSIKHNIVAAELSTLHHREDLCRAVFDVSTNVVPVVVGAEAFAPVEQLHCGLLATLRKQLNQSRKLHQKEKKQSDCRSVRQCAAVRRVVRCRIDTEDQLVTCESGDNSVPAVRQGAIRELLDDLGDVISHRDDELNERLVAISAQLNEKRAVVELLQCDRDVLYAEVKQRRRRMAARQEDQQYRLSVVDKQVDNMLSEVESMGTQYEHDEVDRLLVSEIRLESAGERVTREWVAGKSSFSPYGDDTDDAESKKQLLQMLLSSSGNLETDNDTMLADDAPTIEAIRDLVVRDQLFVAAPSVFKQNSAQLLRRSNYFLNQMDVYHTAMDERRSGFTAGMTTYLSSRGLLMSDRGRPSCTSETLNDTKLAIEAERQILREKIAVETTKLGLVRQRSASRSRVAASPSSACVTPRQQQRNLSPVSRVDYSRGTPTSTTRSSALPSPLVSDEVNMPSGPLRSTKQHLLSLSVPQLVAMRRRLTDVFNALFREHQRDLVVAPVTA